METKANKSGDGLDYRNLLASLITLVSVLGVIGLAGVAIWLNKDPSASARDILTVVLPLLGTWVGTVLAYYFSKENFEAATKSVTELAKQITPQEKLQSTAVSAKMIPKEKMFLKRLPEDKIALTQTLDELKKEGKGNRIPVLTQTDYPRYAIHRSMIDRYLADKARLAKGDLNKLTLNDLLKEEASLRELFEHSFAIVKETDTLATAKEAMDRIPNCQDVFVTTGGTKDEVVKGWITNVIIADNSKV